MEALSRLIQIAAGCSPGMSNVAANQVTESNTKSVEETVAKLGNIAHICEVKGVWALVHAAPADLASIIAIGCSIHPSKKGGNYYAIKLASEAAPVARHLSVAPAAPVSAPVVTALKAAPAREANGTKRVEMKGQDYIVRETNPKRSQDVRRFEVRKACDELSKPYVVSFQSHDGCTAQCSCPDWIYRRRQCKHITGCQGAFGSSEVASRVA